MLEDGLSVPEIAAALGVKFSTLRRRINRLRREAPKPRRSASVLGIPQRDQFFLRLIAKNLPLEQIAERMSVTCVTAIRRAHLMHERGWLASLPAWAPDDAHDLTALVMAGKTVMEIARIMGRSKSTVHRQIELLREEGALGGGGEESPMPKGDEAGFLAALRAVHVKGAGEKLDVKSSGRLVRIYPEQSHSGIGSPALMCARN
jgi:transposase-like protein